MAKLLGACLGGSAQEPPPGTGRGYRKLYFDEVLQAEHGCDFNFLGARAIPRK